MERKLHLTKQELAKHLYDDKFMQKDIAKIYNVSRAAVYRLQQKYELQSIEYFEKKYPEKLSDFQKECLYGSILGDDCIYDFETSKYAALIVSHEQSQKEYIELKYNIWCDFVTDSKIRKQERITKGRKRCVLNFKTGCHPEFKQLRNDYYVGRMKTVKMEHLERLTPVSLAFLFQDDGSRCRDGGVVIHTNCFSLKEVEMMCSFIQDKFGWNCNPQRRAENQYVIYFSSKTSIGFAEAILPYMVPSLRYKLQGVYNRAKNPQRLHAVPFVYENLIGKI